ncbi:phage tail protein [Schaalia sp. ZJ405]|uniref:phage tail spike protein n=1 Tax=Schaalia sp. ZJ405 TaxID=2709403 RepID=UPI0013EB2E76|nr:phage tail spike protein [Schaalia sp. ZJ405]QPK80824.1 phage tail protein [Schaalia sp. ZJ405]
MRFAVNDRWGNTLRDLSTVMSAVRTRGVDATDTLDVTCAEAIEKGQRLLIVDSMDRVGEYIVQSTKTTRGEALPFTIAYCASSVSELALTFIDEKRNRQATATACLTKALEGTRWRVGTVESPTTTQAANISFYHVSALEAVNKVAETFGLEIETSYALAEDGITVATRRINLRRRRGTATVSRRFEYGRDLLEIERTIDPEDVVTRLYPFGRGVEETDSEGNATGGYSRKIDISSVNSGRKYIEDTEATRLWGVTGPDGRTLPADGIVEFSECEEPAELLSLARKHLTQVSKPKVSYTATVAALAAAGMNADGVDIGDEVHIVDTTFDEPLRLQGRVLEIEEDLVAGLGEAKITLGNIRQSYTQMMAARAQALDGLVSRAGTWDAAAAGSSAYIDRIIERINEIMNATGGYTYLVPGEGIYVYDRPKEQRPTKCIHIGGGFWRIANSKKSNGEWNWRNMASGDGIFADTIHAGTIRGGASAWNLETGEITFNKGMIKGGSSSWNLNTGKLITVGMQASSITAQGVFECGSTNAYGIRLNTTGQMAGYWKGEKVGYIDYSTEVYDITNPSTKWHGMQLQSKEIIRISTPKISVAATSDTSEVSTATFTGTITQPVVTSITYGANGHQTHHYGNLRLTFINGLLTSYSTIDK